MLSGDTFSILLKKKSRSQGPFPGFTAAHQTRSDGDETTDRARPTWVHQVKLRPSRAVTQPQQSDCPVIVRWAGRGTQLLGSSYSQKMQLKRHCERREESGCGEASWYQLGLWSLQFKDQSDVTSLQPVFVRSCMSARAGNISPACETTSQPGYEIVSASLCLKYDCCHRIFTLLSVIMSDCVKNVWWRFEIMLSCSVDRMKSRMVEW